MTYIKNRLKVLGALLLVFCISGNQIFAYERKIIDKPVKDVITTTGNQMSNNYQETSLTHVFPRTMPRRPRRPIKGYPSFGDVVKNKPVFPMVKQPNGQKEEKTNNSIPKQPNNKLDKTKDNNKNLKKKNSESLFSNPVFYIVSGVLTLGLLVVIVLIIKRKKKSEDLS